jgi:hypothetical protein
LFPALRTDVADVAALTNMADLPFKVATRVAICHINILLLLDYILTDDLAFIGRLCAVTRRSNFRLAKNFSMYIDTDSRWIEQLHSGLTTWQVRTKK